MCSKVRDSKFPALGCDPLHVPTILHKQGGLLGSGCCGHSNATEDWGSCLGCSESWRRGKGASSLRGCRELGGKQEIPAGPKDQEGGEQEDKTAREP